MSTRGVIFDVFDTLTGPESEWSEQPWTCGVLGIDRRRWNQQLTERSRWRIREALRVRIQRFRDCLTRVPAENVITLERLRAAGVRLGLVSNADAMEIAPWTESPLAGLFDAEVFSCAVGHVKPEKAIYEHCLTVMGLRAEECLFVGHGGSRELEGARAVGMRTVFVSGVMSELWPDEVTHRIAISDHHIHRIPEVLALLEVA